MTRNDDRRQFRAAVGVLISALAGLLAAILSGMALVPRVRLVEVLTVLASGIGAGAGLGAAIVQLRAARRRDPP
jgi:hypothetical protein